MSQRDRTIAEQIVSEPFWRFPGLAGTQPNSGRSIPDMSRSYSIAIVDDDDAVRTSMARLLECEGHQLLSFASGDALLEASLPDQLNCILLDMQMPGRNGLEVLRAIGERGHRPAVLVMTAHGDIPMAVEAMKLGAFDFLQKPFAPAALLAAVESASEYQLYSRASLTGNREAVALVETLSERQRQVLAGIVKGRPNKLIAYDLGLSIRTVEAYRAQTLIKLGVHSTAEAVRIAIAAAMVSNAFGWVGPGAAADSLIHPRTTDCVPVGVAPAAPRAERVEAVMLD